VVVVVVVVYDCSVELMGITKNGREVIGKG
jgi:hypothetical protein